MRTQDEIVERVKQRKSEDPFLFELGVYVDALDAEHMESLRGTVVKQDADLSDWKPGLSSDNDVLETARDYMEFAWDKANNCRGISANRSIMHYQAWLWLLGRDDFDDLMDDYEFYGKPQLVRIAEFLDVDHTRLDDGIRSNVEY